MYIQAPYLTIHTQDRHTLGTFCSMATTYSEAVNDSVVRLQVAGMV